jgi:hypothetical protein
MAPEPEERDLRRRLAALRRPLADDDFAARLHRRLVEAGPPRQGGFAAALAALLRRHPIWGAAGAAAAVAAAVVVALWLPRVAPPALDAPRMPDVARIDAPAAPRSAAPALPSTPPVATPAPPRLAIAQPPGSPPAAAPAPERAPIAPAARPDGVVPVSKVALVELNFATQAHVPGVDLRVELPEGLRLVNAPDGDAGRSFAWTSDLQAGDNNFSIAVQGRRAGRYAILATADVDGERFEQRVLIELQGGA